MVTVVVRDPASVAVTDRTCAPSAAVLRSRTAPPAPSVHGVTAPSRVQLTVVAEPSLTAMSKDGVRLAPVAGPVTVTTGALPSYRKDEVTASLRDVRLVVVPVVEPSGVKVLSSSCTVRTENQYVPSVVSEPVKLSSLPAVALQGAAAE